MLDKHIDEYGFIIDTLDVEYKGNFDSRKKYVAIVIFNETDKTIIYYVLEIKKHFAKDWKTQFKSNTNATGAPLPVWSNCVEINYFRICHFIH